jgi:hypothetical protein
MGFVVGAQNVTSQLIIRHERVTHTTSHALTRGSVVKHGPKNAIGSAPDLHSVVEHTGEMLPVLIYARHVRLETPKVMC